MTEREIQKLCIEWFKATYGSDGECICVPNEVTHYSSNKWQAVGVRKGCSDLIIVLKGKVLFVELKTPQNKQSYEQIGFQRSIENLGYQYYVVRSLDEFIYVIKHAYGPYGPDMRPLDYKDWKTNLEDSLPKDKPAKKLARKVTKQGIEAGVG